MAKGDLISYSNLKAMAGDAWTINEFGIQYNGADTWYAHAPAFVVYGYVSTWSIFGGNASLTINRYYWNGSAWVAPVAYPSQGISVSGKNKTAYSYFPHNCTYGRADTDTATERRHHLWKFTCSQSHGSSGQSLSYVFAGGAEKIIDEATFDLVCKYKEDGSLKPIRGIKPMFYKIGNPSSSNANVTYKSTEQDIIDHCMSNPYRGTAISVDSGTYRYCV